MKLADVSFGCRFKFDGIVAVKCNMWLIKDFVEPACLTDTAILYLEDDRSLILPYTLSFWPSDTEVELCL